MSGAPGSRTLQQWIDLPKEGKVWARYVELSNRNRRAVAELGEVPPQPEVVAPAIRQSAFMAQGFGRQANANYERYKDLYETAGRTPAEEREMLNLERRYPGFLQTVNRPEYYRRLKANNMEKQAKKILRPPPTSLLDPSLMRAYRNGGAGGATGGAGGAPSRGGSPTANAHRQANFWQNQQRAAELAQEARERKRRKEEAEAAAAAAEGGAGGGGGGGLLGMLGSLVGRSSPQPAPAPAPAAAAAPPLAPAPSNNKRELVGGSRKHAKKSRNQRKSSRRSKRSRKSTRRH